jgi:hypothetical protein
LSVCLPIHTHTHMHTHRHTHRGTGKQSNMVEPSNVSNTWERGWEMGGRVFIMKLLGR